MMRKALVVCVTLLALQASATEKLPADVRDFIADREGCDHMRGEVPDPPDKQRMQELEREIRKICTGTDRKLARLKRKYASNRPVMKRLREFEPTIEEGSKNKGSTNQ